MGLLEWFGKPDEVREALSLLKGLRDVLPDQNQALLMELAEEARMSLRPRREREYFVKRLRAEGRTVTDWAYTYVITRTADRLESGHYHVYRGILDLQGQALMSIFERGIQLMIERNAYSAGWADENIRQPVLRSIRDIG